MNIKQTHACQPTSKHMCFCFQPHCRTTQFKTLTFNHQNKGKTQLRFELILLMPKWTIVPTIYPSTHPLKQIFKPIHQPTQITHTKTKSSTLLKNACGKCHSTHIL